MIKKIFSFILGFLFIYQSAFAVLTIDSMEATCDTDAHAQVTYVTNATGSSTALVTQNSTGSIYLLGDNAGIEYRVAQSFTLDAAYTIDKVMIDIDTLGGGSPTTACTVRIETNSSSLPSGSLADANATKTGTLAQNTYVSWDFDTNFELAAGTYWIVMTVADQANNNSFQVHATDPSAYSGGNLAYSTNSGASWTAVSTRDLTFRVYYIGVPSLQSYSGTEVTAGTYSLKGVATTGALNKTLTRTVSYNLTGVTTLKFDMKTSRTGSNIKIGLVDSGATTEVTPNQTGTDYQTNTIDLSAVSDANKDAITSVVITVVNADDANTFFIDNFLETGGSDIFGWVN